MRKFNIKVNGETYEVEIEELGAKVQPVQAAKEPVIAKPVETKVEKPSPAPVKETTPAPAPVKQAAPAPKKEPAPVAKAVSVSTDEESVTSPMPGVIIDVKVKEGDTVKANEVLLVLEAMKMENEVMSPREGVVTHVAVEKGSNVSAGDVMIVIK